MITPIDIITQEQVVITFNIAIIVGNTPQIEESHQVLVLSVHITEDLDWSVYSQDHGLFLKYALTLLSERNNMLTSECKITIPIELSGPLTRSQQMRQEQIVKGVFLHVLLLGCGVAACRLLSWFLIIVAFEFLHRYDYGLAAWLLFDFCAVKLNLIVHAGETLHGRCP